ncbi:Eco57I restriction-modification methylase domain-containing protein [Micromonospora sp. LOL_021]|uniref:Eco57I restriction-modification methylase domain-containing protein n=1 Tax=Micromonospora sp. LOL_021 TaxID=3345417 RepID=UPI003A8A502B
MHLIGWNADLDKPAAAGGVRAQSMVQECLNRSDAHLWGVLSNGRQLRLLRDSNALATAAYVEFDLEAIFDGELFSEFVLLYRLLHVSRFDVAEGAAPSTCWLERWRTDAISTGVRALEYHREAVKKALQTLGTGFLKHPANGQLRRELDVDELHAALLRLVYRLIFLFAAEDRDALHPPGTSDLIRERYAAYFSSARLRRHANRRRGTAHTDLYQALRIVLDALGDERGRPELGLPGLGGIFDDGDADTPLRGCALANADLLTAVRQLSRVWDPKSGRWRATDYRNMGSEELGSIYESLLELVPKHSALDSSFTLVDRAGNNRKKTGSYYTPSSLIERLLDSTLDPVIDDAQKRGEVAATAAGQPDATQSIVDELLSITVCDPACGSGHFLVAAARRIAKRVAAVRERNPEPTVEAVGHALHEVIARCVYGVDLNPMAVELAKVSLWLEALEPGTPLSFLDAHIKHGNGLIGALPALRRDGIPTRAFKAIEGDDPKHARLLERLNDEERAGQFGLFDLVAEVKVANADLAERVERITNAPAGDLSDVRRQAAAYQELVSSADYTRRRHLADAWCAAFVWRKAADAPPPVTDRVFRAMQDPAAAAASQATYDEIERLADEFRFFHWDLEFPEIFHTSDDAALADVDSATGWAGGFSCVLGNPPWDKVDFEDKKYFSVVDPSIAELAGATRRARIVEWVEEYPEAGERYHAERRRVKATFHFAGGSGTFPLCAKGLSVKGVNSLQTDQLFTERFTTLIAPQGRTGVIVPTAIATGAGAQHLFSDLARRGAITTLLDFENRKPLFLGVHSSYKFCLLALTGRAGREPEARYAFFLEDPVDLDDPERAFSLSPEEIALINPNTGNLPIFRTRRDADLTVSIYRRVPILKGESPSKNRWPIQYKRMFDITDDSTLFHSKELLERDEWTLEGNIFFRDGSRMLPLHEGRMGHQFSHRFSHSLESSSATPVNPADPSFAPLPEHWIAEDVVEARLAKLGIDNRKCLLGHRRIARNTDERTMISAILPLGPASYGWILSVGLEDVDVPLLAATYNSFAFDYLLRSSLTQPSIPQSTSEQIPVPEPKTLRTHADFITPRVMELAFTSFDLQEFAVSIGDTNPPFIWNPGRQQVIRAEIDALFFCIYAIPREEVEHILDSFPIIKKKDLETHGAFRTKSMILAEYDRMTATKSSATTTLTDGVNYTSTLNPPPGYGPRHRTR